MIYLTLYIEHVSFDLYYINTVLHFTPLRLYE